MAVSIYLDANFLIRLVESPHGQNVRHEQLWDMIDTGRLTAMTSWLTWSEVLVHPLRHGDDALVAVYDRIFAGETATLACHDVERPVLRQAAEFRARWPALKSPDAIHLATAALQDCGWFVTSDARLAVLPRLNYLNPDIPSDIDRFLTALP
ncbi:type II toxin-antitoxin system VapC family toxin [Phreatobacter aquaticus]|uniref:Type II toxin-antitoxin system VapC family toxin n=1 Tax=Phreatobacter aquaticus TaxID=2570229 RepID=A0A4D7QJF4_9HYPH|nr:PIN domain-containing protein [Phreatobacter aquaticus]QCK85859.1 type II toxin-antitoxin system VapC family toxin [Phreatobacter aquaticus]